MIDLLTTEITELQTNVLDLIYKIDTDIFHSSKNLERKYLSELGQLECDSFALQYKLLREQRKFEIIKDLLSNKRYLDLEFVEKVLDIDFEEHIRTVQERAQILAETLAEPLPMPLSPEDESELASLYKTILSKLHPSLNPNLTEEQNHLFCMAISGFINKDLPTLNTVIKTCQNYPSPVLSKEYKELLSKVWEDLQKQQDVLSQSFPFSVTKLLVEKSALEERKKEFNAQITYYKNHLQRYEAMTANILNQTKN
ncbi:MAG TPA: hypothetical protein IAB06_02435 [Candidatus Avacidaminococcus intestinavium]|uniref:Uncharacterized protein n=1 Tax=Candidatus Avacidaminococcus intestinavium TaxID=2840684 RepID=A0A9D1SKK0_9FIRM|nr:hypothetical protein [Candidatus Avacidaminococcus intestinavium]